MGKGDARTKRGKIFKGSYGKTRRHTPEPATATPAPRGIKPPRGK